MADDLIQNALRKATQQDGEFRLVATGEAPDEAGLFPDRKGPAKKAIQESTEGEKPLLKVREEPGKGKTPNQFARITDAGIQRLAALVPLPQFPELIAAAAPSLRTKVIRSCLRALARRAGELNLWVHRRLMGECLNAARGQFDEIEARFQELLVEEKFLNDSINEFLKATRDRIEKQKQRINGELDTLVKASTALISPAEVVADDQPSRPRLPEWQRVPTSNPEIDFQKNLSEELVFTWQDATKPEVKAALERALFNVGVERLAEPGDVIPFDGRSQHTEDDVDEGEPVEVVLPGWQLVNPRGSFLIARAKVRKTNRASPPRGQAGTDADGSEEPELPERTVKATDPASREPEGSPT